MSVTFAERYCWARFMGRKRPMACGGRNDPTGKREMKITYTSLDIEAPDLSSYDLCNAEENCGGISGPVSTSSTDLCHRTDESDKRYTTVASAIAPVSIRIGWINLCGCGGTDKTFSLSGGWDVIICCMGSI